MTFVNPNFAKELERFGEDTASECFNCGTCAAICPLIYEHFPRRMIRCIQLGAKIEFLKMPRNSGAACTAGFAPRPAPEKPIPGKSF